MGELSSLLARALCAAFSLVLRLPVPVCRPRRPRSDIWVTGTTAWALAVTRWQSSLAHPPPAQPRSQVRLAKSSQVWPSHHSSPLSRSSSFPQILLLCSHPPTVLVRTVSCPGSPSRLSFACNSNFLSRPKNPESSPLTSLSISDTCSTACSDFLLPLHPHRCQVHLSPVHRRNHPVPPDESAQTISSICPDPGRAINTPPRYTGWFCPKQ